MDITKLISSIICFIAAIFLGIVSAMGNLKINTGSTKGIETLTTKEKGSILSDVLGLTSVGKTIENKIAEKMGNNETKGGHDNEYTSLDDAQFHYSLNRMKDIVNGSKEIEGSNEVSGSKEKKRTYKKKAYSVHSWYKHTSWDTLIDSAESGHYVTDREHARLDFLFDWEKVFAQVWPYVKNETHESIGVIRADNDRKTLFVYKMELAKTLENNDSYAAGISYELVEKYADIPGYFLFHTHPLGINADPFPSDADIYSCLLDCYTNRYVGHAVIGEYGIIVYYLNQNRFLQLLPGGPLKYFTFCYDLINAWNAYTNSSIHINQRDRVSFLEKWGFTMVVIPSSKFISDSHDKVYTPGVIHDRFIKTKYELLDRIKNYIKKLEEKE